MAVAIDASTPAIAAALANTITTSSFNPPDSSLLVAIPFRAIGLTMSNNGTALTWTSRKQDVDGSSIEIFTAPLPAARTGMTVTVSGGSSGEIALKTYVLTGADLTNPVGATGAGNSGTNNVTVTAYTSTIDGSRGLCGAYDSSARGLPTSTDNEDAYNIISSGMAVAKAANTTPAGTNVTFNLDAGGTAGGTWYWIAVEILPQVDPLRARLPVQSPTAMHRSYSW